MVLRKLNVSDEPQSTAQRTCASWAGNTQDHIVTGGTVYHDTGSKGYSKSGKRVFKDCYRAEIMIGRQRYRYRSKERQNCVDWLEAVRQGKIKPTDNKSDWRDLLKE